MLLSKLSKPIWPLRINLLPLIFLVSSSALAHVPPQFATLLTWATANVACLTFLSVAPALPDTTRAPPPPPLPWTRRFPISFSRLMPLPALKVAPVPPLAKLTTRSPRELSASLVTFRLLRNTRISHAVARNRRRRVTSASTPRAEPSSSTTCPHPPALLAFAEHPPSPLFIDLNLFDF